MSLLRQGLGVASPPAADEIAERVRYAVDMHDTRLVDKARKLPTR